MYAVIEVFSSLALREYECVESVSRLQRLLQDVFVLNERQSLVDIKVDGDHMLAQSGE